MPGISETMRDLQGLVGALEGETFRQGDRIRDLEMELGKTHDTRVSSRDGIIRDMAAEMRRVGYDVPCDEDGIPLGWSRPERLVLREKEVE